MKTITFFTCGGLEEASGIGRYMPLARYFCSLGYTINYLALHPNYNSLEKKHIKIDGININV